MKHRGGAFTCRIPRCIREVSRIVLTFVLAGGEGERWIRLGRINRNKRCQSAACSAYSTSRSRTCRTLGVPGSLFNLRSYYRGVDLHLRNNNHGRVRGGKQNG